jgi:hypothetical protein
MGLKVPEQRKCERKEGCSPNSEIGRLYRVKRTVLSQIDWDNPQFSYRFKLVYSLRTKIERPALSDARPSTDCPNLSGGSRESGLIFTNERAIQDETHVQARNRQNPWAHPQIYESHAHSR